MDLEYRAAQVDDFETLYALHREVMRGYVEDTWGPWDDAWQREHFTRSFDPARLQIIQWAGKDIGVLYIDERAEEIFIANLEILPAFQRRGIGTQVIRGLIDTAARQGKPVALRVLKVNRAARSLYQRLGFGITGENETHYIMAYEHREA